MDDIHQAKPLPASSPAKELTMASPSSDTGSKSRPVRKRSRSVSDSSDVDIVVKDSSSKKQKSNRKSRNDRLKSYGRQSQKSSNEKGIAKKGAKNYRNNRKPIDPEKPKPIYVAEFSKEEIAGEERRPKKKCAVMIGYCGSGYHGLQIMSKVKTIEGDMFEAFVAAGAISKANADDPKKSQLVRCARTDKGVHAWGNVLSLKIIIEDENIVQKINEHLPPQLRVWGIEQTVNSFSAYQQCDSRIYEYLIPTHVFLPPHPQTFLAKKLEELAAEANDLDGYKSRQGDILSFWEETERDYVKPVMESIGPELRTQAAQNVFNATEVDDNGDTTDPAKKNNASNGELKDDTKPKDTLDPTIGEPTSANENGGTDEITTKSNKYTPLEAAIKSIKAAHLSAKHAYRIAPTRLARIHSVLAQYLGTHAYHNYTVSKKAGDPSCKRHIKSFEISGEPFLIGDTEWISLKVHGQSFMMHQIRKMVMMAAMLVRCGTDESRIEDSFKHPKMIIPRAPALGLLLERPIFDAYNKFGRCKGGNSREPINFEKYAKELEVFKQKEIYERMWKDEAESQVFANLFGGLDSLRSVQLLWATSLGVEALEMKIDGAVDLGTRLQNEEKDDGVAEDS